MLAIFTLDFAAAQEEKNHGDDTAWRLENGRIFKNDTVFVDSGLDGPLGIVPAKNDSVIVAQRAELTQIFDENNDGKADFFRALISGLPAGYEFVSGPMTGENDELFLAMNRAGFAVDLIVWKADATPPVRQILELPKQARALTFGPENQLAALISDPSGTWVSLATINQPSAEKNEPPPPAGPVLKTAVRLPNALFGDDAGAISQLRFSDKTTLLATVTDGRVLEISLGEKQGSARWHLGETTPFAIEKIQLVTDGFAISLTKPADRGIVAAEPLPFQLLAEKFAGTDPAESVAITRAAIEPDGLTLTLVPEKWLPERVYLFDLSALKSETGEPLAAEKAAVTVIAVPEPTVIPPEIEPEISDPTLPAPEPAPAE